MKCDQCGGDVAPKWYLSLTSHDNYVFRLCSYRCLYELLALVRKLAKVETDERYQ